MTCEFRFRIVTTDQCLACANPYRLPCKSGGTTSGAGLYSLRSPVFTLIFFFAHVKKSARRPARHTGKRLDSH